MNHLKLFNLIFCILLIKSTICFEDTKIEIGGESLNLSQLYDPVEDSVRRKHKCKNSKVNNLTVCSNLCAQNACINNLTVKNIINGPSFVYGHARFVDPINGSDDNNGGTASPFRTITKALSTITDNSSGNRYAIILFPGPTVEPAAINWKSFVSLFGFGKDACIINQNINYTASPGEISRMDFSNIQVQGGGVRFNLDASAGANVTIRIICSRCNCTWNGGGPAGIANQNILVVEANTQVLDCIVIDGIVGATAGTGFFNNLTVNNGTSPIVQMIGAFLSDGLLINLHGNAQLITRGTLNRATVVGVAAGGNIPLWDTDASSMTPITVNTGINLRVLESDAIIASTSVDFLITKETTVLVDATAAPRIVALPSVASYIGRSVTVKKVDPSANPVAVQAFGADLIDGTPNKLLANQYDFITVISNGANWSVIGSGL